MLCERLTKARQKSLFPLPAKERFWREAWQHQPPRILFRDSRNHWSPRARASIARLAKQRRNQTIAAKDEAHAPCRGRDWFSRTQRRPLSLPWALSSALSSSSPTTP